MSLLLAIEPDGCQANALEWTIRQHVEAELVLASSKDAAIDAIGRRVPDLILVSPLLNPREENDLAAYLRTLDAPHLQTLTVPFLATPSADHRQRGWFRTRKPQARDLRPVGCDPGAFAVEIAAYLERARTVRAARARTATPPPPAAGSRATMTGTAGEPTHSPAGSCPGSFRAGAL